MDRSCVVYWIKCKTCGASYIGYTDRKLEYRVREHQSKSSAVYQHAQSNPGNEIGYSDTKVIDTGDNELKLCIKELLHIIKKKPKINIQLGEKSGYNIKTIIVASYEQLKQQHYKK